MIAEKHIEIREATEADLQEVLFVEREAFGEEDEAARQIVNSLVESGIGVSGIAPQRDKLEKLFHQIAAPGDH